jgi:uncharacterized RDD family membrane protein YckC
MLPAVEDTPNLPGESPAAAPGPAAAPSAWAPPPPAPRPGPAPGIEYAGFWVRTLAYVIDAIPFLILSVVFVFGPFMTAASDAVMNIPMPPPDVAFDSPEYLAWEEALNAAMVDAMGDIYPRFWLLQAFPILYFVGFWTWRGQTPGLMLFGLRVAREADGRSPGFARSILRFVGYWICWITLFIGFFWVGADSRKQGWHDKIAGTVVVRRSG